MGSAFEPQAALMSGATISNSSEMRYDGFVVYDLCNAPHLHPTPHVGAHAVSSRNRARALSCAPIDWTSHHDGFLDTDKTLGIPQPA